MKLIRPSDIPATRSQSGGYVGSPQSPLWRKEWIEDQKRWTLLSCGCVIDIIHDRSLLIINAFPETEVHCDNCQQFSTVIKQMKTKRPKVEIPQQPLF